MENYYYGKPRGSDPHTSNVVVILMVTLILLCIPWLFSSEPEEEEVMDLSPFVAPILIVVILLLVTFLGSSR
ncbi:hypothetical protein Lalb_Chr01g0001301 [Lupinus albus]|uniref:Transmembrane protein n=1 Tax=Lupinus albus TaxID=3870 RepID=A0A6A4R4L2_LUPAL|nr:hypothetical protein Lalb_Chr01g0001301 [Lupinus albus]